MKRTDELMKRTDGLVDFVNNTHSFVYSTVFMDELLMRMLDNASVCVCLCSPSRSSTR